MTTHESEDELDILYLRTFRRDELSLLDAVRMAAYCVLIGRITMLGTPSDNESLRAALRHVFSNMSEVEQSLNLIAAGDDDWRVKAIQQIVLADVIILQIRPKEDGFPELEPGVDYSDSFDHAEFYATPLSKLRTGQGLLTEVAFLHRLRALPKTILLLKEEDAYPLERFVDLATLARTGDIFSRIHGKALPRMALLDQQLAHLREVGGEMQYGTEAELDDIMGIARQVKRMVQRTVASDQATPIPSNALLYGTCPDPRPVFPDYSNKIIGHTAVEALLSIPEGFLIEADQAEVSSVLGRDLSQVVCPRCQQQAQRVFFYRGALGAPITDTIYGRCQTCGRAVSVTPDGLIDD